MISSSYHSGHNTVVTTDSRLISHEIDNKTIYVAVFSTSLLLYTFFNTFTLAYISYYNGLDQTVLGFCIYFNISYLALFGFLFRSYSAHRFLLVSLSVYVVNTCLSCIILGVVNNSKEPMIYNIIYGLTFSVGICIYLCKNRTFIISYSSGGWNNTPDTYNPMV